MRFADDFIELIGDGPVSTVWLKRPAKRNAMTYAMWQGLIDVCAVLAADRTCRVVVLRGAGDHFCAGADINDLHAVRASDEPGFMDISGAAERALSQLPQPTIAVLQGDCVGGGCSLAIDCDLRVAATSARFAITPAKLGIAYPAESIERLTNLVGPAHAKQLLYTGQFVDADHAHRIGLVNDVVDGLRMDQTILELAGTIAQRSSLTQQAAKEMIASVQATGSVRPDLVTRWATIAATSDDPHEGLVAFRERRQPQFGDAAPDARQ